MYKLKILATFEPKAEMADRPIDLPAEYDTADQAALRAMRWLTYRPRDIVMLVSA